MLVGVFLRGSAHENHCQAIKKSSKYHLFPHGSVYSTKASGAEQTTETNNSLSLNITLLRILLVGSKPVGHVHVQAWPRISTQDYHEKSPGSGQSGHATLTITLYLQQLEQSEKLNINCSLPLYSLVAQAQILHYPQGKSCN